MPFCPLCRADYGAGIARCTDCDVDLIAERPKTHADDGWVEVFRGTLDEADAVVARLEAKGIEPLSPDEYAATTGSPAPVRILVRAGLVEQARKILAIRS